MQILNNNIIYGGIFVDSVLKNILSQYDQKKLKAEIDARKRKQELYEKYPKLQNIDDNLTSLAISTTKTIINNNDTALLAELNKKIEDLKKEKSNFLKSINIPENYFEPFYECNICKDSGYITNSDYSVSMCSCLRQKIYNEQYNKANIFNLDKQNFNNFSDKFYSDKVDIEKYHTKISPRENINLIKNICLNFISNFDNIDQKNLLFTGNTGLGKTFLSSCIANEILKKGKNVLYQTAPVMLDSIIDYRFGKRSGPNILESILNVDLLIIDDLGTECINNMKFTELFNIINTRLLNQNNITKTIISTNLSLKNLYSNYDERIVSRIVGNYDICYFFGDDIRFIKKSAN